MDDIEFEFYNLDGDDYGVLTIDFENGSNIQLTLSKESYINLFEKIKEGLNIKPTLQLVPKDDE